ncbi:MAG TPA: sulfotransferase [Steroidobacteraceae bacterium]|nr:sulfotransferase [Steroidobacteraceae bacterium]
MSSAPGPVGTVEVALGRTARLLATDPATAAEQAAEILKVIPGQPQAMLLLGVARRKMGGAAAAVEILSTLIAQQPHSAAAHYELGLALGADRKGEDAVSALRRALQLKPELSDAWRALGDHLTGIGDTQGADEAYAQQIKHSTRDPRLMEAGSALVENRIAVAEALLREHLKQFPTDVAAIRMLAEVAARLGRNEDAENLLRRCLELAPSFNAARYNLAQVFYRQSKAVEALTELECLLAAEARHPGYRNLKAAVLSLIGEYRQAIEIYAGVLAEYPGQAMAWMSYGHALKTAGRQEESIRAYRRSVELKPALGEAYWSLANMKTVRFAPAELDAMRSHLQSEQLRHEDRFHFHFAMGKALEDAGGYAESFEHYSSGNSLRRARISYDADETTAHMRRSKALFSKEFLAERASMGSAAPDPIFVVGLPRSGSTLLEQILSSHPQVEGTMELPYIISMVRSLGAKKSRAETSKYPEILATLSSAELLALGTRYLEQSRIHRKTEAPFFIDKMPNNFAHIGLIHLILPNAKIIDARRHPLGCCFSGFKQHFARGQHFTYGLEDIGRYYHDYVELMAHLDAVLPGRVHRVIYEKLIDDFEAEVRRVLDYCGLPFDESCLRFYENERAVRTASSEQVRQPIFRDAVDHWRNYEPWLGPLKSALGPVLEAYPSTPPF